MATVGHVSLFFLAKTLEIPILANFHPFWIFSLSFPLDPCEGSYLAEHDSMEDCLAYWESTIELQEESGKTFSTNRKSAQKIYFSVSKSDEKVLYDISYIIQSTIVLDLLRFVMN